MSEELRSGLDQRLDAVIRAISAHLIPPDKSTALALLTAGITIANQLGIGKAQILEMCRHLARLAGEGPQAPAIQLWDWDHAPEQYRKLSTHGGDEDGVIFVPDGVEEPWWLESLHAREFGDAQREKVDGGAVIIWAHA